MEVINFRHNAFTLAELLIALAILGVIATFTIPKILMSTQDQTWRSEAKEVAAALSEAYQKHAQAGLIRSSTKSVDFIQYLNYVKYDTTKVLDESPGDPTSPRECDTSDPCLQLSNGDYLYFWDASFGGTTKNRNAVWVMFDPDGVQSGDSNKMSVWFCIYYGGRVVSIKHISNPTQDSGYSGYYGLGMDDPSWFSW